MEQIVRDPGKAHEGHAGERRGNQSDGKPFEAFRRFRPLERLADAAEQDQGQTEADAGSGAVNAGFDEVVAFIDVQDGDRQHRAVGGDERQINTERLI